MDFPLDVVRFAERRFNQNHLQAVYELLETEEVNLPRTMRAVLYLSGGNLIMLKHYVKECANDVHLILKRAEYVVRACEGSLFAHDTTLPFTRERNLGEDCFGKKPSQAPIKNRSAHHTYLANRKFRLGNVNYAVAKAQPHSDYVCCYREQEKVVSSVRLPLVFVVEQLAEHINVGPVKKGFCNYQAES